VRQREPNGHDRNAAGGSQTRPYDGTKNKIPTNTKSEADDLAKGAGWPVRPHEPNGHDRNAAGGSQTRPYDRTRNKIRQT
jgi:hypothetical protein